MNATTAAAVIGHNKPDLESETRGRLARDYAEIERRVNELASKGNELPATVTSDDESSKISDFVKDVFAEAKKIESLRTAEKEPYLASGRAVDGYFNSMKERLDRMKRLLEARVGDYLRVKAAEERRIREAAERAAREEAQRKMKEAEEAAAKEAEAKAALDATRTRETEATLFGATRETNAKIEEAIAADNAASRAAQDAAAKPADLARTRSTERGSVATLKQEWTFEVENYDAIPLDVLRPHIALDAIDKAIRAYVKVGNRSLAGVRIFETTKTMIR